MPRYEWQPAKPRTVDVETSLGRRVVPVQSFDTARTIAHNIEARHDDARRREQNVRRAAADDLRAERATRLAEEEASEHRAKMQALAYNDDEIKRLLLGVREGMLRSAAERKLFEQRSTRAHARHEAVRPPSQPTPVDNLLAHFQPTGARRGARTPLHVSSRCGLRALLGGGAVGAGGGGGGAGSAAGGAATRD
jgi:hypothetical protein